MTVPDEANRLTSQGSGSTFLLGRNHMESSRIVLRICIARLAGSTRFVPASRAAEAAEPDPSFAPPTTDHKIAIRSAFQEHVPNQPGAGSTY